MSDVCEICEKAPADPGDCMCVPCRIETTAAMEVIHDPVLIVLNRHQHICGLSDLDSTMCMCGERFEGGPGYYRVHVATLIYEALGLEEALRWFYEWGEKVKQGDALAAALRGAVSWMQSGAPELMRDNAVAALAAWEDTPGGDE